MQEQIDWLEYLEDGRQQCLIKHFENKAKGTSHAIVVVKGRILLTTLPN